MKNQKLLWAILGTTGGLAILGAGAAAIWNSRQMKIWRLSKKAEKILFRTGSMLQSIATAGGQSAGC